MRRELWASRGVRVSSSRLRFSMIVSCVTFAWVLRLTHLLSAQTVGVGTDAGADGIPGDEDGEDTGESGLDNNQDDAGDGLGGLGDTKLFDKDEDASDGKNTNRLDDDVENVAGAALVGSAPEKQDKHAALNDELGNGLRHAVAITSGNASTFGKHVDDDGNKQPPVVFAVGIVEEGILGPDLLVLVEGLGVTLGSLEFLHSRVNLPGEEGKNTSKETKSDTGERLGGPRRIGTGKLEDAVQDPDSV